MHLRDPLQAGNGTSQRADRLNPRFALTLEWAQLQLLGGEQVLRNLTERVAAQSIAPSLTAPTKCGIRRRKVHSKVQPRAATPVVSAAHLL
jgi:hypothetical protein